MTEARHPDIERVLLDQAAIRARIVELGRTITEDYSGKTPVLIAILKGSFLFLADLVRELKLECSVDFIGLSSYSGDASTGVVRLTLDLKSNIQGKDILIVEDIIDTGLTLSYLKQNFETRHPKSMEICTLLDKPDCRKVRIAAKYTGFKIPNEFVVGYGLDFDEKYRNLPYIGVLNPQVAGIGGGA